MKLIQHITVGSGGAASITFSSIPATFTDLQLVVSSRSTGNTFSTYDFINMAVNGGGINFTFRLLQGSGSGVGSFTNTTNTQIALINGSNSTASTFSSTSLYFPNYASATAKSFSTDSVHETNATEAFQQIWASLWNSTAAINSLSLSIGANNFAQHSSATLYGILRGSDGITTAT